MKIIMFTALLTGLFLTVSSTYQGQFYQVISSHPHDVEEIEPYIETAYQNGRLWVVRLKKDAPSSVQEHLRPLSGGEKSYLHKPLFDSKIKLQKSSSVLNMVEQVDKENIRRDVEELSSYRTRRAGTQENQQAVKSVADRLTDLGYEVQEICYSPQNCSIIAERKGRVRAGEVIMVMGHIDSVGKTFAGADDNASGTAVILEMARVLRDYSNRKTLRFFVTNGEEQGLIGATHYARKLQSQNQLSELALVINMDMVGYNSNGVVELETDPQYDSLAKWYAELAGRYTKLKSKITLGAWGSDHVPFLQRGVPALLTIENWDTKTPCYHQECDKPDTLNYEYASEIGKLNVSAVLTKDQT